jgi:general secretion pathway protein J
MNIRRPQSGFTLLEVLVAIGLLALLLALAYGSIRAAVHATRSGEALIARSEEMRAAQTFLRRQFAAIMPLPFETNLYDGLQFLFEGNAEAISFVAPMPGYLSRGGPHAQRLAVVNQRGSLQLEFTHSQLNGFEPGDIIGGGREPVVLAAGLASARFEFRQREADGLLGPWSSEWNLPGVLPQQVRLQVEFPQDDLRQWPPLEVPVLAAASFTGYGFGNVGGAVAPTDPNRGRVPRATE